jgi:hypothetical protein
MVIMITQLPLSFSRLQRKLLIRTPYIFSYGESMHESANVTHGQFTDAFFILNRSIGIIEKVLSFVVWEA